MTVEARFMTPEFLSRYSDIVLSYQWECGLNYLYYETIYGNYPLVHNSEYLAKENIGYFYREFDAYDGADALMHCIYAYDKEMPFHQERNKKFLHKVSVYNPENISRHRDLLLQVLQEK